MRLRHAVPPGSHPPDPAGLAAASGISGGVNTLQRALKFAGVEFIAENGGEPRIEGVQGLSKSMSLPNYQSLYMAAQGYTDSAILIPNYRDQHNAARLILPECNSIGISLELYMKAVLFHSDSTERELRILGHNLEKIINALMDQTSFRMPTKALDLSKHVSELYRRHEFRYFNSNRRVLNYPDGPAVGLALQDLSDRVADQIDLPRRPSAYR